MGVRNEGHLFGNVGEYQFTDECTLKVGNGQQLFEVQLARRQYVFRPESWSLATLEFCDWRRGRLTLRKHFERSTRCMLEDCGKERTSITTRNNVEPQCTIQTILYTTEGSSQSMT